MTTLRPAQCNLTATPGPPPQLYTPAGRASPKSSTPAHRANPAGYAGRPGRRPGPSGRRACPVMPVRAVVPGEPRGALVARRSGKLQAPGRFWWAIVPISFPEARRFPSNSYRHGNSAGMGFPDGTRFSTLKTRTTARSAKNLLFRTGRGATNRKPRAVAVGRRYTTASSGSARPDG
jgi:hypothetical protein